MFGHDVVTHDFAQLERVERNAARLLMFGERLGEPMWLAEPIHDTFQPGQLRRSCTTSTRSCCARPGSGPAHL